MDDGSTDGSEVLLNQYARQAAFPVRVFRQENRGKHLAWNFALTEARGELFVPLDSDDSCTSQALERFRQLWLSIPGQERGEFSGVNVLCQDPTGRLVGTPFPADRMVSNNLELYFVHKVRGEKWGCIRTDVLRSRPFPAVQGHFLPETYIWYDLARRYKVLCVNEVLRVYHTEGADRLCRSHPVYNVRSAPAIYEYDRWHLATNLDFLWKSKSELVRFLVNFWRSGFHTGRGPLRIMAEVGLTRGLLALPMMGAGGILFLRDRLRGRNRATRQRSEE